MQRLTYTKYVPTITHPLLVDGKNHSTMLDVLQCRWPEISPSDEEAWLFLPLDSEDIGMQPDCIVKIQQFLHDPSHSGSCYVDSGMYAALS